MRYPTVFPPWYRVNCSRCGVEHLATRTQAREIKGPEDEVCGDCQDYDRAYKAGYEAGRRDALDKILPRLKQIADTMEPDSEL